MTSHGAHVREQSKNMVGEASFVCIVYQPSLTINDRTRPQFSWRKEKHGTTIWHNHTPPLCGGRKSVDWKNPPAENHMLPHRNCLGGRHGSQPSVANDMLPNLLWVGKAWHNLSGKIIAKSHALPTKGPQRRGRNTGCACTRKMVNETGNLSLRLWHSHPHSAGLTHALNHMLDGPNCETCEWLTMMISNWTIWVND